MAATTMKQEIGNRYGRLIVLGEAERRGCNRYVHCHCDCGAQRDIDLHNLRRGLTLSCGCLHRERLRARNTRHGGRSTPTYTSWRSMIARCRNPRSQSYSRYGRRGITLCPEWAASFAMFLANMGARPSPQHILERVDNSRGYEPGNVVWATRVEQARNKRGLHLIAYHGRTLCLSAWAEEVGILRMVLESRLRRGWTVHRTMTQPARPRRLMPLP